MSTSENTPKAKGWQRWILVASLTLNLFLVGLMVGGALGGKDKGRNGQSEIRPAGLGPYARVLDKSQRRALAAEFRKSDLRWRDLRKGLRTQGIRAAELLQADVFDAEAFLDLVAGQRKTLSQQYAQSQEVFVRFLAELPDAERKEIGAKLEMGIGRVPKIRP